MNIFIKHLNLLLGLFCLMSCENGFYNEDDYVIKMDTTSTKPGGGGGGVLPTDTSFARGVDVSWCTEMEADGLKFYSDAADTTAIMAGTANSTEIFQLMKNIGMAAVRLRVWVNPEKSQPNLSGASYGPWCDKADLLVKARRAKALGMDILIDFHYSDYFVDPGKQYKPVAWEGKSQEDLKTALADHTKDILSALKAEGITPKWVQVGNETTNGMVWEEGRINWKLTESARWSGYVALSNAGYNAVKEIFPDAYVIVHVNKAEEDCSSFFHAFKEYGGLFDMIGLSYYPSWDGWEDQITRTATRVQSLYKSFRKYVMIVETGYSNWEPDRATEVMTALTKEMKAKSGCRGVFYWEPEIYGGWTHLIDEDGTVHRDKGELGKYVQSNGAFTKYGQPDEALKALGSVSR